MEVERLKLRKCPEFPTFSAFLARLPLGAGEEGSEPGFQLRWVEVERETREGEFEMLSCEYLRSAEYDGFAEEEMRDLPTCLLPPVNILFNLHHLNSENLRECLQIFWPRKSSVNAAAKLGSVE